MSASDRKRDTTKYVGLPAEEQKSTESTHAQSPVNQHPEAPIANTHSSVITTPNLHAESKSDQPNAELKTEIKVNATPKADPASSDMPSQHLEPVNDDNELKGFIVKSPVLRSFLKELKLEPRKDYTQGDGPQNFELKLNLCLNNFARFWVNTAEANMISNQALKIFFDFEPDNENINTLNQVLRLGQVIGAYINSNGVKLNYKCIQNLYYDLLAEQVHTNAIVYNAIKTKFTYTKQYSGLQTIIQQSFTHSQRAHDVIKSIDEEYAQRTAIDVLTKNISKYFSPVFELIKKSSNVSADSIHLFVTQLKEMINLISERGNVKEFITVDVSSGNAFVTDHKFTQSINSIAKQFYSDSAMRRGHEEALKTSLIEFFAHLPSDLLKKGNKKLDQVLDNLLLFQPFSKVSKRAEIRDRLYRIGVGIEEDADFLSTLEISLSFYEKNYPNEVKAIADADSKNDLELKKAVRKSAFINILSHLSSHDRETLLKKTLKYILPKDNKLPSDLMTEKIIVEDYLRKKYEEFKNEPSKLESLQKKWFYLIEQLHQVPITQLDEYFKNEFVVENEKESKETLNLAPSPTVNLALFPAEDKAKVALEQKTEIETKSSFIHIKISKPDEEKTLKPNASSFGNILINMLSRNDATSNQKALEAAHKILSQLPLATKYHLNNFYMNQLTYFVTIADLLKSQNKSAASNPEDLETFESLFTQFKNLSGSLLSALKDAEFLSGSLKNEKLTQIESYQFRLRLKSNRLLELLNTKSLLNFQQPEVKNTWLAATRIALTSKTTGKSLYDVNLVKTVDGTKLNLRDKLSRNMNDYFYIGRKPGGANNQGDHTGVYGILYLDEKDEVQLQRVLFKKDSNDKNIIEVVCGHLMNHFIGDSAASVFLATLSGDIPDSKLLALNARDDSGLNIYVGSIMYDGFTELYAKAYLRYNLNHLDNPKPIPKTRPHIRAPFRGEATKIIDSAFAFYKDKGLARAAVASLWLSDHDSHTANLGVARVKLPNGKEVEQVVKIDHGGAMVKSDFTDEVKPFDSRLINMFKGINIFSKNKSEPTGHFAEIPRSVCISPEFANAIDEICGTLNDTPFDFWTIRKNIEANLSRILTKEVIKYYGFKPFNDFANRIGVEVSDELRRAQSEYAKYRKENTLDFILKPTYEYLASKIMKRLDSLREFGLEIKTSLYVKDKDSNQLKALIRQNPSYFFAKKYRLRGEGQRFGSIYTFRFGPFDSSLVEKIDNAIRDVQFDLVGRRDIEATLYKKDLRLKLPERLNCLYDRLVILRNFSNNNDRERLNEIIAKFGGLLEKMTQNRSSAVSENQLVQACDDAYKEVVSNYNHFLHPLDIRPGIDEILMVNQGEELTPEAYFAKLHKNAEEFLEKKPAPPTPKDKLVDEVETKSGLSGLSGATVKKTAVTGKDKSSSSAIGDSSLPETVEVKSTLPPVETSTISPDGKPTGFDKTSDISTHKNKVEAEFKTSFNENDGIELSDFSKSPLKHAQISSGASSTSKSTPTETNKSSGKALKNSVKPKKSRLATDKNSKDIEMFSLADKKKTVSASSSQSAAPNALVTPDMNAQPTSKMDIDFEFGAQRRIPTYEAAYQEAFGAPSIDPASATKLSTRNAPAAVTIVDENTQRLRAKYSWKDKSGGDNPHIVDRCKNQEYFTEAFEVEKLIKVPRKSFWDNFRPGKSTVPDDGTIDIMYRMLLSHIDARKMKAGESINIDINVKIEDPAKNKEAIHTALLAAADIKHRFNITIDLNTYLTKPTNRQVTQFSEYLDSKHGSLLIDINRPKQPANTKKNHSKMPIHNND